MQTHQPTVDGKTFAIGILSVTATILFVGFLVVTMLPTPASAIGQSDRGGDYIMLTQQLTTSNEGIVIIDAAAKRLIVYGYDYNRKQIVPMSWFELEQLQKPAPVAPQPGRGGGGRP